MTKDLIVSTTPQETKVALLEDGVVSEIFIERETHRGIAGNVYKGRVTRVLPGMQSAFVDIGQERDAFLHVADVFEELPENLLAPEEVEAARSAPIEDRLREGQEIASVRSRNQPTEVLRSGGRHLPAVREADERDRTEPSQPLFQLR